jgi:hypothetical protein
MPMPTAEALGCSIFEVKRVPEGQPNGGELRLGISTPEQRAELLAATATASLPAADFLLGGLINLEAPPKNHADEPAWATRRTTEAVALLAGIGARDSLEALLAAQMVALHHLAMSAAHRAVVASDNEARGTETRQVVRLSTAFGAHLAALKAWRSTGQSVTVQHQHIDVNAGAQAVIGTGGGARGT